MDDWWIIGSYDQAYIMSKTKGHFDIPLTGWRYSDGNNMHDDNTLRVTGNNISCTAVGKHYFIFYNFVINISTLFNSHNIHVTEGEPTYPDTVTVSSTGDAADSQPESLGVYKITPHTWSGRPVWQHTVRDDRYLFYNGNNLEYI